jgi:hypothetical protein
MQALRSPLQRTVLPTAPNFMEGKRVSIGEENDLIPLDGAEASHQETSPVEVQSEGSLRRTVLKRRARRWSHSVDVLSDYADLDYLQLCVTVRKIQRPRPMIVTQQKEQASDAGTPTYV